uniref:Secondary alcohol dehydrogenase n=1 Tax=Candidozyma auris TaxID=498019 RepID=A0A0L0NX94_CANAR
MNICKQASKRILTRAMATIPKTQYGFKFDKLLNNIRLVENLPVQTPSSNQVLLKIEAAGLCHTDLHLLDGFDAGDNYVMGHEIFGLVALKGEEVSHLELGDKVAAFGPNSCGVCSMCRQGYDNDCLKTEWLGLGNDGGYQQYLLVKNPRNLIKVPSEVSDPAVAAVITDAMLTPYHAIKMAELTPAKKALFIGAGGLGSTGVQIAKLFGSHVTVLDTKPAALELAKQFGADEVYTELPSDTKPGSFDVCLDFVAIQKTFEVCQMFVKPHGTIIPVGLGATHLSFDLGDLALREVRVLGSFWGTSNDITECYELVKEGKIHPKVTTFPLKELPECIERLKRGDVSGRMVLIP